MKFGYLRKSEIEAAVEGLLHQVFGPPPWPVPVDLDAIIFDHLAEHDRLAFDDESYLEPEEGEAVLGIMVADPGRIKVCRSVGENGPIGRYRFTVAHEVGHWVLHREACLARDQSLDLFDSRATVTRLVSLNRNVFPARGTSVPREEWQANQFASRLLVPKDSLATEFMKRFGTPPVVVQGASNGVARRARELATERVPGEGRSIHEVFQVSVQAMSIAIMERGYVTNEETLL